MNDENVGQNMDNSGPDIAYPTYPNQHSDEAHNRAKYIEMEIASLDDNHYVYVEAYNTRRAELELMLRMCHQAIVEYDNATQPQHAVPMSNQVPSGVMRAPTEAQRTPYDVGVRPPTIH